MREQLIYYVDFLFAGAEDVDDIKQEILQNTLDRYDDLVSQGKMPEAAYSLAITGIGDIDEILKPLSQELSTASADQEQTLPSWKKMLRIIAVFLCGIDLIPVLLLTQYDITDIYLSLTIIIACVAAVLLILSESKHSRSKKRGKLRIIIDAIIIAIGLTVYLVISIHSGYWQITWLIFPIIGAACGLSNAVIDLKEGC